MSTIQRSRLVNFNRVLILALTLTGLLMDGVQHSDLPFTLALVVWLWLTVFARMQSEILSRARRPPDSARERVVRVDETGTRLQVFAFLKATKFRPIS